MNHQHVHPFSLRTDRGFRAVVSVFFPPIHHGCFQKTNDIYISINIHELYPHYICPRKYSPGWWFGTWILFVHILGIIIPTDFHIFQRGGYITNQSPFSGNITISLPPIPAGQVHRQVPEGIAPRPPCSIQTASAQHAQPAHGIDSHAHIHVCMIY